MSGPVPVALCTISLDASPAGLGSTVTWSGGLSLSKSAVCTARAGFASVAHRRRTIPGFSDRSSVVSASRYIPAKRSTQSAKTRFMAGLSFHAAELQAAHQKALKQHEEEDKRHYVH